jgi:hypothetical protein
MLSRLMIRRRALDGSGDAIARRSSEAPRRWGRILDRVGPYLRGIAENPAWALIFTLGRVVAIREMLRAISHRSGAAIAARSPLFDGALIDAVVGAVRQEGICLGIRLPDRTVADIRTFADTQPCYGGFDRNFPFLAERHAWAEQTYGRRFLVGHFLDRIEYCGAIRAIEQDPVLNEIAARYVRADPVVISTRLWWSFPSAGAEDGELRFAAQSRMHTDINDWRSIKFFFYLTDVDVEAGAHIFIRGTHRRRRLRHQFTLFTGHALEALLMAYGTQNFVTVCGRAGFGFAEDPFAFHSGTVVRQTPRLILQVEYGVTPTSRARFFGG